MNLIRRRKRPKFGTDRGGPLRSASHLKWLRGNCCSVEHLFDPDKKCEGKIEAAHVRTGTDGGMASKPSDFHAIALCERHHREQHQIGEAAFERRYAIDMKKTAASFWEFSPVGKAYRRKDETAKISPLPALGSPEGEGINHDKGGHE